MEIIELRQINEFRVIDDQGIEHTLEEYQNVTEKRSLRWVTALPSWFELADGTPVRQD